MEGLSLLPGRIQESTDSFLSSRFDERSSLTRAKRPPSGDSLYLTLQEREERSSSK